jgi:hypothetical protein
MGRFAASEFSMRALASTAVMSPMSACAAVVRRKRARMDFMVGFEDGD